MEMAARFRFIFVLYFFILTLISHPGPFFLRVHKGEIVLNYRMR